MEIITGVQTEALLKALCWTFIHSLWQGLGYALLAGVLLLCTKRSTPVLRYNLLLLTLLLFVITTGITFYLKLPSTSGQAGWVPMLSDHYTPTTLAGKFTWQQFATYCDANAPLLVLLWFIVFIAKFIKMIGGLLHIKYIRNYRVSYPGIEWQEKIAEMATVLRISAPVKLLESALIKVPIVVGWLKPVIMIPAGLLTQLPQDQMEAILLHELAHIRRKDYFVNLLQSFVEIFFFFNPAVCWLSALLREEREHCCDDQAVTGINNKSTYIKALVAFQEYCLGDAASSALAFAGSKHQLLERVKRIVFNKNKNLNNMEKVFLTTSIFVLLGIALVPAAKTQIKKYYVAEQRRAIDTINGVIQPVKETVPPVKPDNSLQHIISSPAGAAGQDTQSGQRYTAQQQEREKAQQRQDSTQLRFMQDQELRDHHDSLGRIAQADMERALARRAKKDNEMSKAIIAREAALAEANEPAKKNNVARNVPAIKPITPVEPVSAIDPSTPNPKLNP